MDLLLKEQIDIKKRLKNIELLSEINNDPNFIKVSIFNLFIMLYFNMLLTFLIILTIRR
jgi:hypothetical protein